jgi:C-terminal processing protease CtpA/Prc
MKVPTSRVPLALGLAVAMTTAPALAQTDAERSAAEQARAEAELQARLARNEAQQARQAGEAEIEAARAELERAKVELEKAAREFARQAREHKLESPSAFAYEFITDPDRAMLGVTIAKGPKDKGRYRGVLITGITPGGGADKAGLRSGDLLVAANGSKLDADGDDARDPTQRLVAVMEAVKPGDKVALDYERDGKRAKTTVTATRPQAALAPLAGWRGGHDFDVLVPPVPPVPPVPALAPLAPRAPGGLQLVRIDDDLAVYFKTKDGVLVIAAPDGGSLALKSGDVIRRINGRSVASPVAAWEEIANADDAPLKLQVTRQGKAIELSGTLPQQPRRHTEIIRIEKNAD